MTFIVFSIISVLCCLPEVLSILPGTVNGCKETDGTRFCCTGFYELDQKCFECIGSFGHNCSNPCPPGWFGPRCRRRCACPDDKCDDVDGCPKDSPSFSPTSSSSTGGAVLTSHANIPTDVYVEKVITKDELWGNLKSMGIQYWIIVSSIVFLLILTAFSMVVITCYRETKQIHQNYRLIEEDSNSVYAGHEEETRDSLNFEVNEESRGSVYADHNEDTDKLHNIMFSAKSKSDEQIVHENLYMHLPISTKKFERSNIIQNFN
ncbi:uncharacterized protein LOC134259660 isoform X2 [Saccostrea cucullata]|uniref:uncharacterized protein LOC134259660 isoform X2 n=1 Tax=Saccostrea cuccullata TaxID=36930 RepID=UPI002ED06BCE